MRVATSYTTHPKLSAFQFIFGISLATFATPVFGEVGSVQNGLDGCTMVLENSATDFEELIEVAQCNAVADAIGTITTFNCSSKEQGFSPRAEYSSAPPPSKGAAIQAFVNWARSNPDMWGEPFSAGMMAAIVVTFPCDL